MGFCDLEILTSGSRYFVIATKLPDGSGMTICNAFEDLFVQVCRFFYLDPTKITWIECWTFEGEQEWSVVEFELEGGNATHPYWHYLGSSRKEALSKVGVSA